MNTCTHVDRGPLKWLMAHASLAVRSVKRTDPPHYHFKVRHISHWRGCHLALLGTLAAGCRREDTVGGGVLGQGPLDCVTWC